MTSGILSLPCITWRIRAGQLLGTVTVFSLGLIAGQVQDRSFRAHAEHPGQAGAPCLALSVLESWDEMVPVSQVTGFTLSRWRLKSEAQEPRARLPLESEGSRSPAGSGPRFSWQGPVAWALSVFA